MSHVSPSPPRATSPYETTSCVTQSAAKSATIAASSTPPLMAAAVVSLVRLAHRSKRRPSAEMAGAISVSAGSTRSDPQPLKPPAPTSTSAHSPASLPWQAA